ncbi:MAG: alkaline phosphatase family protein [bacterium]|nr:alkaline phosphatase family protein [bacterium]
MRGFALTLFLFIFFNPTFSQSQERPKLIVGIVVDQMRIDYLYRYEDKFGDDGFKRLMNDGFYSVNTHYNYTPTNTGPGHASIFSGTTPANHGIIGNEWYSKELSKEINCVGDSTVKSVGTENNSGMYSPKNLIVTNLADEIRLQTQKRGKVIGLSIKNRGAILPSGHMPNGAYWYDWETGNFVTSEYYRDELPKWVKKYNDKGNVKKYLSQTWNTLLPIEEYTASGPDDSPYEGRIDKELAPIFPYDLKALQEKSGHYGLLPSTPWGNTVIRELAEEAIKSEELGADKEIDLLTISFSAPDYIGHRFGTNAVELQDCYLRLDLELAQLLKTLDEEVGKGEYTVFLTADHAVAEVPQYLMDNNAPAGYIQASPIKFTVGKYANDKYGEGEWFLNTGSNQIFLNRELIKKKGLSLQEFQQDIADLLMTFDGIKAAFTATDLMKNNYTEGIRRKLQKGYNPQRSGDVFVVFESGWFPTRWGGTGTNHGSGYNYDTHVPLLIYGKGIKAQKSAKYHEITDIIPSLCLKYEIKLPSASDGKPILELFD